MNISLYRPLPEGFGMISQWFGEHAVDYSRWDLAGHNGLDYAADEGTPVRTAHNGRVISVSDDPAGYGLHIRIAGPGYETLYAHLSATFVVMGEVVNGMQCIGATGNTGNSTGPHLHFALKIWGMRNPAYRDWVDPVIFRDLEG